MKIHLRLLNILVLFIILLGYPDHSIAQWSKSINLSPNAVSALLNESMGSCIAVNGDTVHVVWADRFNSKKGAIFYTQSIDTGNTWSTPIAITDTNSNAWNPAIAVNGSSVHVVWRTIDTSNNAHRKSWYIHSLDGGLTWGTSVVVDTSIADWPAVAVSGNTVYVANDIVTSASPYNTEIFFIRSLDNGTTWGSHQQLTFSVGRSEDEAITAQGPEVYMSWNDNRNGSLQIFFKHSGDYGLTWDQDELINNEPSYGTMVSVNNTNVDIVSAGAPSGHYQIHLNQSPDGGNTWGTDKDLTNDPTNTYYYPYMVRDGSNLHMTYVNSSVGGQYLHSDDGGTTWDSPFNLGYSNITPFVAYSYCVVHVIMPDSGHINYRRNQTANSGPHCITYTGSSVPIDPKLKVNVYPNPLTTQSTIEITSSEHVTNTNLKLFNILDQEILNTRFDKENKFVLHRENLESGIYLFKVFLNEKIISTGKIIVK